MNTTLSTPAALARSATMCPSRGRAGHAAVPRRTLTPASWRETAAGRAPLSSSMTWMSEVSVCEREHRDRAVAAVPSMYLRTRRAANPGSARS